MPLSEAYTEDLDDEDGAEDTATFTPESIIEQSVYGHILFARADIYAQSCPH